MIQLAPYICAMLTKDNKICYYPITNQDCHATVTVDEENMNIEKVFHTGDIYRRW